jgi:hypothetical protein
MRGYKEAAMNQRLTDIRRAQLDQLLSGGTNMAGGGLLKSVAKAAKAAKPAAKAVTKTAEAAPQAEALRLAQQRAALPPAKGGLGLAANNTPEQRAAAMGINTDAYHGTKQDIKGAFVPGYNDDLAFVTKDPDFASKWVGKGKMQSRVGAEAEQKSAEDLYRDLKYKHMDFDSLDRDDPNFHAEYDKRNNAFKEAFAKDVGLYPDRTHSAVYPMKVEANKTFNPETDMDVMVEYFAKNNTPQEIVKHFQHGNYLVYENQPVVDFLKSKGYDSMRLRESTDDNFPTIAVFNPETIRSRFAAFDPFRKTAATAAAAGLAAPDLLAKEQDKAQGGLVHLAGGGDPKKAGGDYTFMGDPSQFAESGENKLYPKTERMNRGVKAIKSGLDSFNRLIDSGPSVRDVLGSVIGAVPFVGPDLRKGMEDSTLTIPYGFETSPTNPKVATGVQTAKVPTTDILDALKMSDLYGGAGASNLLGSVGKGEAPNPMDVLDTLGLGAIGYGAAKVGVKGAKAAGKGALKALEQAGTGPKAGSMAAQRGVVKMPGGNFLTGRVEKDVAPLKRRVPTEEDLRRAEAVTPVTAAEARNAATLDAALNKWVDSNLSNYIKKQMGTPDDPVRALAEQGITHKADLLREDQVYADSPIMDQRRAAGFPEKGMAQSPLAKAWEYVSDSSIASHRAGDIQEMPGKFAKHDEAERKMIAAREDLDKRFENHIENFGLNDREKVGLIRGSSDIEKATMLNDVNYKKLRNEYLLTNDPMMSSYITLGSENPWISKVAPETQVYSPYTGDLGFDHIVDVLKQDVAEGRIRPEQLNKVSMEQAVRRTYEYDQEMAKKMRETQAKVTEGMPVYKEYPEGYKWIELAKPKDLPKGYTVSQNKDTESFQVFYDNGTPTTRMEFDTPEEAISFFNSDSRLEDALKYEGDTMGHCVGGYCPDVAAGRSRIFSLRDAKGEPHVTVEVTPNKTILNSREIPDEVAEQLNAEGKRLGNEQSDASGYSLYGDERDIQVRTAIQRLKDDWAYSNPVVTQKITQIKGKQNRAPKEEYLPFVQDFVKGGNWSDVGDLQNTGLKVYKGDGGVKYVTPEEYNIELQKELGLLPPEEGMAGGGLIGKLSKAAKMADKVMPTARIGLEAPGILIPSKMNNVREAVRNIKGNYGARRVERAADEIPNLERMFTEGALGEAFTGDNAKGLMTINPAEFERYAQELSKRSSVGPKAAELAKQGDIDKYTVPTDDYIKYLQQLSGGFSDVPYLNLFKDEVGLPDEAKVIGHEGRHRNRALAAKGDKSTLVQIQPRGDLREGMPRRTQEDFIEALRQELDAANRLVVPESEPYFRRPSIELPDVYAEGGSVGLKNALNNLLRTDKPEVHMALGGKVVAKAAKAAAKAAKVDHPLVFPRAVPKSLEEIRPIAQRMAEQMTGELVKQNPNLTTNPAGKSRKQFEREKSIPLETRNVVPERAAPDVNYEDYMGYGVVGVPGDPTLGGVAKRGSLEEVAQPTVELTRVGDITPDYPVPLFGGPRYGDNEKFWASNFGAAVPIQKNASKLADEYQSPIIAKYIKMGSGSENFALHNLDALLAIQRPERLDKAKMAQLTEVIQAGSPKYGKFPGFTGFEEPIDVLLQAQMNSNLRKHIAETLTKPTITNELGLANGLDVVAAITHPELRNLETGASGFSVGKMKPGAKLQRGESSHPTYDTDIPGSFLGRSKYPTPYEIAFPDTTAYARSQMTPGVQEFNMMKMLGPRERIDQQYIDEIKMYEELMKKYTGKKKGGLAQIKKVKRHGNTVPH